MFERARRFYRSGAFRALGIVALICALAYAGWHPYQVISVPYELAFDDAYMFARYADNLLSGNGFVWNPGERAAGCTSLAYGLFMALARYMAGGGVSNSSLLVASSFLWGMISLLLIYMALSRIAPGHRPLMMVLVACIAVTPLFLRNTMTGMDTMMAVSANALLVLLLVMWQGRPLGMARICALALAGWLAYFVRPDSGLHALLLPPLFLLYRGQGRKAIASYMAMLSMLLGADTLARLSYFGTALPLSYYVKKQGFYAGYAGAYQWNSLGYLFGFLMYFGLLLVPVLLMAGRRRLMAAGAFALPVALTSAYLMGFLHIMGYESRLFMPSMPVLLVGSVYALAASGEGVRFRARNILYAAAFALLLLGIYAGAGRYLAAGQEAARQIYQRHGAGMPAPAPGCRRLSPHQAIRAFDYIVKLMPPGLSVAASEHGYIAAHNRGTRILDLMGLHDRRLALEGYSDEVLEEAAPDIIWMPHEDYTALREKMVQGRYFRENYTLIPGALAHGVALKDDSPLLGQGQRALIREVLGCGP